MPDDDLTFTCRGIRVRVEWGVYAHDGSVAIRLNEARSGEPWWCATVCLEHAPPPAGCVNIKTWSENEGLLAALVDAGLVADTGARVPAGHAEAAVCRLLVTPPKIPLSSMLG